jgi:hypothetical protein
MLTQKKRQQQQQQKPVKFTNGPLFAEDKLIVKFPKVTSPVVTENNGATSDPEYVKTTLPLPTFPSSVDNTKLASAGIVTPTLENEFPKIETCPELLHAVMARANDPHGELWMQVPEVDPPVCTNTVGTTHDGRRSSNTDPPFDKVRRGVSESLQQLMM